MILNFGKWLRRPPGQGEEKQILVKLKTVSYIYISNMSKKLKISSPGTMIELIREQGMIPFFRSAVPGWSIEEQTAPGCWFFETEGILGPWDWKIDVVRTGEIAYGKFLAGKAAFATLEWYRHLMNWRRSLPLYRIALGEKYDARSQSEKKMQRLAAAALAHIRKSGECGAKELRTVLSAIDREVKKSTVDSVLQFLQMGTWIPQPGNS